MAKKATTIIKEERLEDNLFDCCIHLHGRAPITDKHGLLLTLVFMKFIGERSFPFDNAIKAMSDIAVAKCGQTTYCSSS